MEETKVASWITIITGPIMFIITLVNTKLNYVIIPDKQIEINQSESYAFLFLYIIIIWIAYFFSQLYSVQLLLKKMKSKAIALSYSWLLNIILLSFFNITIILVLDIPSTEYAYFLVAPNLIWGMSMFISYLVWVFNHVIIPN